MGEHVTCLDGTGFEGHLETDISVPREEPSFTEEAECLRSSLSPSSAHRAGTAAAAEGFRPCKLVGLLENNGLISILPRNATT